MDEGIATLAAGILNLSADLLATITPIPLVMRLNMRLKYRIGVSILFGLGFIVIVAGIVRTYYIWKGLMDTYDATWYAYPLWIAAAVEIDVGVVSIGDPSSCSKTSTDPLDADLCVRTCSKDIVPLFVKQHSGVLFARAIRPKQPTSRQREPHEFIETVIKEKLLQRDRQTALVAELAVAEGFG